MFKTCLRVVLGIIAVFAALILWRLPEAFLRFGGPADLYRNLMQIIEDFFYIAAAFILVYLLWTKLDKRPFREIGFAVSGKEMLKHAGSGALLGGILYIVVPLMQLLFGVISFRGNLGWSGNGTLEILLGPMTGVFMMLAVGFSEELFFRGYIFQTVWKRHGLWAGVVVSSLLFSAIHFINPGYTLLVFVNILMIAIFFALTVSYYRSILPAMGFHFAWNWMQYCGLVVSTPYQPPQGIWVFSQNPSSPAFLSGGAYGCEGSLYTTMVIAGLLAYYIWRINTRLANINSFGKVN